MNYETFSHLADDVERLGVIAELAASHNTDVLGSLCIVEEVRS